MQSRYYCIYLLLLRSFMYQLLHNPNDQISRDNYLYIEAICIILQQLIFMEPIRSIKQLILYYFTQTQVVLTYLYIFAIIRYNNRLKILYKANVNLQILRLTIAQNIYQLEDLSFFNSIISQKQQLLQPYFIFNRRAILEHQQKLRD